MYYLNLITVICIITVCSISSVSSLQSSYSAIRRYNRLMLADRYSRNNAATLKTRQLHAHCVSSSITGELDNAKVGSVPAKCVRKLRVLLKNAVNSISAFKTNTRRKVASSLLFIAILFMSSTRSFTGVTHAATQSKMYNSITKVLPTQPKKSLVDILASSASVPATKSVAVDGTEAKSKSYMSSSKNNPVQEVEEEVQNTFHKLSESLEGIKLDSLILLIVTSAVIPIFKSINTSPILGFLLMGTILGPTGLKWVKDLHMIELMGELGIVFFLFEVGLELSMEKLKSMKKDVFGLGSSQFLLTTALATSVGMASGLAPAGALAIGGSLALSSSAFVLQLLKDKDAIGTKYGKASFGILLLQDLAVVPLIVIIELLGAGGGGLGKALSITMVKAIVTISSMSLIGRRVLNPVFYAVAKSGSREAFLSIILSTVFTMSFVTKGIGLSDTLGAFLAGILLAETKFHYQIESDISPFRGLLLGFFFMTVGFSIDVGLIFSQAPKIFLLLVAIIAGKASIITMLSVLFGVPFSSAQLCGLLNSQVGEFAFVALGIAERMQLIPTPLCKLLLTTVALSMAVTPMLGDLGIKIMNRIDDKKKMEESEMLAGLTSSSAGVELLPTQKIPSPAEDGDFVLIIGFGRVGKMICDILDRQFIRYIVVESNAIKANDAGDRGLPVYYGDISRPEIFDSFHAGSAKACVLTFDDMATTNRAVVNLRRLYPSLPILVRAKDLQHQKRLEGMFDDVSALSPNLPEDSVLLTLPFGGAVLQKVGVSKPEIDAIMEEFRKEYMGDSVENEEFDFLNSLYKRLPSVDGTEDAIDVPVFEG